MDHIAIDLGGRNSQVCIRNAAGQIVEEKRCPTPGLRAYLAGKPKSRVVVETCAEAFSVADAALAHGHEIRVVPATLVRNLGVGARRTKTDKRDAQVLSEVSSRIDLPSVHVPTQRARERKTLCGMREGLVQARTQLINCVRGWLRAQGHRIRSGTTRLFPSRVRSHFAESSLELPGCVERQLKMVEQLSTGIEEASHEIDTAAKQDETCRRLMTVPGVGPTTAVRFVAAIDQVSRFPDAHKLESYLGLVPGEDSSSEKQRRTGITKAGPSALRWALVQTAWSARRCKRKDPIHAWADEVERRRGKHVAVLALARKIAGILFALWRDGDAYQAERGSKPISSPLEELLTGHRPRRIQRGRQ